MMNMNYTLNQLREKNLLEVFGERDSARRMIAINAFYTEDCTFFETNEEIVGVRYPLMLRPTASSEGLRGLFFVLRGQRK
jgi:hypothetical protein